MTPGQSLAWQRGKLDVRCNACGATSAATSQCNQCHSRDLAYLSHAEQQAAGSTSSWCGNNLVRPSHLQGISAPGGAPVPPAAPDGQNARPSAGSGAA